MARLGKRERERIKARALAAPVCVAPAYDVLADQATADKARLWNAAKARALATASACQAARAKHTQGDHKGKGMATATPIAHARPLSATPATSDLAPAKQRSSYRFHEPMGTLLKARLVHKRPTAQRFSQPALAPCTPAQFAAMEQADATRQYQIATARALRDAEAAEFKRKETEETRALRAV